MPQNFDEIINLAKNKQSTIAVAASDDENVIGAATIAMSKGIANFILVGDKPKIEQLGGSNFNIIHTDDKQEACKIATGLVRDNKAQALMKGSVDTSVILKAALDKTHGIRTDKTLSHIAGFELSTYHKILFITDPAINIAPDLQGKKAIIHNAVYALNSLGIPKPKVALIAAKEKVDPKMPVTIEYETIVNEHASGFLTDNSIIDGPLALDNAISLESCKLKGINSPIAGDADIILCPNIEVGNTLYKSLAFLAGAKTGGVVIGAKRPIILTSRADNVETKLISIALSLLF